MHFFVVNWGMVCVCVWGGGRRGGSGDLQPSQSKIDVLKLKIHAVADPYIKSKLKISLGTNKL